MKRPNPEYNAGNRAANRAVLIYLRRKRKGNVFRSGREEVDAAITFVENYAERTAKRKGGAGRK